MYTVGMTTAEMTETEKAPRNIVVRQQDKAGAWVPRDAWYVMDADTKECFAWHYQKGECDKLVSVYEVW